MKKLSLILIIPCIIFSLYFFHFNNLVHKKFDGQLWELPARVYARPLELYQGLALSPENLEMELGFMGYRRMESAGDLSSPGTYVRSDNIFDIYCRGFDFGDKKQGPRRMSIRLEQGRVAELNSDMELVRLDPILLGSFYPVSREDRILVELSKLPPLLPRAIVGVEDRRFFDHFGIEPRAILRALMVNIKDRRLSQGASTITQQLARNFFLTKEKTLVRKVNEAFVAAALELNHEKEDILEAYINEVYLGQSGKRAIHGFGLGSVFYFGKPVHMLDTHEIALLVGLLKGPSYYNPRRFPDRALVRRNIVLKLMGDQQIISKEDMEIALASPLGVIKTPAHGNSPFPDYLDLVKQQLLKEYREEDLRSMGLRIFTSLDPQVQHAARQSAEEQLDKIASQNGLDPEGLEAGVVVTATASNEIQALVGGKTRDLGGFNRALYARRPIGSLVKPAVYLAALNNPETYTLVTRITDGPVKIKNKAGSFWEPKNFSRVFHGQVPLYKALVHSYNASTVWLGMDIGLPAVWETWQKMGYQKPASVYPSFLLGSLEMSPFEVAQVYQTLASGGFYTPARGIRAIFRPDGKLVQRFPLTIEQRLDPAMVFLVNKMLQAVVMEGTGKDLEKWLPRDLGTAGKTGSTNDLKDSWFAGFTGNRLAVVWVGRDDNSSCGLTGSAGAMQVFGRLMSKILNQSLDLIVPERVEWAVIDASTGLLTEENCPGAMAIPFIQGSSPVESVSCSGSGAGRNGEESNLKSQASGKAEPGENKINPKKLIDWFKGIFK